MYTQTSTKDMIIQTAKYTTSSIVKPYTDFSNLASRNLIFSNKTVTLNGDTNISIQN